MQPRPCLRLAGLLSEGTPGMRHFGGSSILNQTEILSKQRALSAFQLDPHEWGVNVQPFPGALANLYTFSALPDPGDALMGLDVPHGGHISHGYRTAKRTISETAYRFRSVPYYLDSVTGRIDYDGLETSARQCGAKLIIAGASAYTRLIDYGRMRRIADQVGVFLVADTSHTCGLVAARVIPGPFEVCDVVTSTAYKTIRDPPGAVIFARRPLDERIDGTVFPRFQSSANDRHMIALAVAFEQTKLPEFIEYQETVLKSTKRLAHRLCEQGFNIVSDGTDNHLVLVDLRGTGVSGARLEKTLEKALIDANRNIVPGEKPGTRMGIRFGINNMVTRGFDVSDFDRVAYMIGRAMTVAKEIGRKSSAYQIISSGRLSSLTAFARCLDEEEPDELVELRREVEAWVLE